MSSSPVQPPLIGMPRRGPAPKPPQKAVEQGGRRFVKVVLPREARLRLTAGAICETVDTRAGAFADEDAKRRAWLDEQISAGRADREVHRCAGCASSFGLPADQERCIRCRRKTEGA